VTVLDNGNIAASDGLDGKIIIFDKFGKQLHQSKDFEKSVICGIAVTENSNILVTDYKKDHHCVLVLDSTATLLHQITIPIACTPFSIAVDPNNGNMVLSTIDNLYMITKTTHELSTIDTSKIFNLKEVNIKGVAIDSNGTILFGDGNSHKIHLLNSKGDFLKSLPCIESPFCIAVDYEGRIIYSTTTGNKIVVME